MGGNPNLIEQMFHTDGYAKKESGEDIRWGDVDVDKLEASRERFNWRVNSKDDNARVAVNNSKGAMGCRLHPSTPEVRQALKIITPAQPEYLAGFSQASQGLPNPVPQEVVTPALQEGYGWVGKPSSDDNEQSNVGQIS